MSTGIKCDCGCAWVGTWDGDKYVCSACLLARIAELEAIVERNGKLADGPPVILGDEIFVVRAADEDTRVEPDRIIAVIETLNAYGLDRCYSTRAAAEAAAA